MVVINFLNRKNAADQRLFELLRDKFRLNDGVFGASDEVLGALGSGADFEERINDIYQCCRTPEDITRHSTSCSSTSMNGAGDSVLATLAAGRGPSALCHNSTNNKVYCANDSSDNVTVIDGATDSVITTVTAGDNPMLSVTTRPITRPTARTTAATEP